MDFRLRVLVVDDEPLVRGLLAEVLKSLGYEVEAASNAAEARDVAKRFDPDVAILDVDLGPGPNGFDLELAIRHTNPQVAIVFLSNIPSPKMLGVSERSLSKGAAYLLKTRMGDPRALSDAINMASRGLGGQLREDLTFKGHLSGLTRAQLEVIELVSRGYSNDEIAKTRGTSVRAVRMIVSRAFKEMGIESSRGSARVRAALNFLKATGLPK